MAMVKAAWRCSVSCRRAERGGGELRGASAPLLGVLEVRQLSVGKKRVRLFLGRGRMKQCHAGVRMLPLESLDPSNIYTKVSEKFYNPYRSEGKVGRIHSSPLNDLFLTTHLRQKAKSSK